MESDKETNPIPEIQRSAIVMGCPTIFPAGSVCGQVVETSSSSPANRHTPLCPRLFISPGVRGVDNTPHKLPMATRDIYETGFDGTSRQTPAQTHVRSVMAGSLPTRSKRSVRDCGLVIDEQRIDHGPEWRTHDQDQRKRTGAPLTAARHDRGLSTEIGRGKDANGNNLSGQKHQRLSRMRREQSRGRFQSKAERNLAHGLGEVRRISGALELQFGARSGVSAVPERTE